MGYSDGDSNYPVKTEFLKEIHKDDTPNRWIDGVMAAKIELFRGMIK